MEGGIYKNDRLTYEFAAGGPKNVRVVVGFEAANLEALCAVECKAAVPPIGVANGFVAGGPLRRLEQLCREQDDTDVREVGGAIGHPYEDRCEPACK